jgi:cell division protein FtsN
LSRSTASFFPFFLKKEDTTTIEEDANPANQLNTEIVDITEEENLNEDNSEQPLILDDEIIEEFVDNSSPKENVEVAKNIEKIPVEKVLTTDRFFIIAGSFSNETNAKRLVTKLNNKGYSALIADTNKYGMFRVAIMKFNNRVSAENNLMAIRNEENPQAWLLVK